MINLHESMEQGRDWTRDPWICSQTRICCHTRYRLHYPTWLLDLQVQMMFNKMPRFAKYILILIKRRQSQFNQLCWKKYRHEHVMITNAYIVSHILYECQFYECITWAFCACRKEVCGCTPTTLWNALPLFNQLVFQFGKYSSLEGIPPCTHQPRIS